jgi:hypothetical protein
LGAFFCLPAKLHCRIGSSERCRFNRVVRRNLHCRIGSLEMAVQCITYSRGSLRFLRAGITTCIPCLVASSTMESLSSPQSANRCSAALNHGTVRIGHQGLQPLRPHPFVWPPAKAPVGVFPVSIVWRPIAPWRTRAQNPETALISKQLSLPIPPQEPRQPSKCGSSKRQTWSEMSWRRCAGAEDKVASVIIT